MRYVFGPVPSRRLGRSLGVDLVPFKTCSYDCVYCQLGRTTAKTIERSEYVPVGDVLRELKETVNGDSAIDYITLSGSGEPTLHSGLGEIIRAAKRLTSVPVAVLTNGSLLHDPDLRRELGYSDVVIPSLDAASERVFQQVNRPHEGLDLNRLLEGLKEFTSGFGGMVWVEVMLVRGMNDADEEIRRMNDVLKACKVKKIQINTVIRPPAEPIALPVGRGRLKAARQILGERSEAIGRFTRVVTDKGSRDIEGEIVDLVCRRPCSVSDISGALGFHPNEVLKHLGIMVERGTLRVTYHKGETYYASTGGSNGDTVKVDTL